MAIYTHNGPINYECTSVHMIVTDAPRDSLGISDDWFEVNVDDVAFTEELTGREYPESQGWQLLSASRLDVVPIQKWGRL